MLKNTQTEHLVSSSSTIREYIETCMTIDSISKMVGLKELVLTSCVDTCHYDDRNMMRFCRYFSSGTTQVHTPLFP